MNIMFMLYYKQVVKMKIIVVSDSHGKQGILEQIVEKHPDADAYLHCGDIEDYAGKLSVLYRRTGNNDIY